MFKKENELVLAETRSTNQHSETPVSYVMPQMLDYTPGWCAGL